MRGIKFSTILQRAAEAAGRVFEDMTDEEDQMLRNFCNLGITESWESEFWPDLMLTERRFFHPLYNAANAPFAAGAKVYKAKDEKYFQSLKSLNSDEPGASGVNSWYELKGSYDDEFWESSTTYTAGSQVLYDVDMKYYACHTAPPSNEAPSDTNYWGEITTFERAISTTQTGETEMGEVAAVYEKDPDIHYRGDGIDFEINANGVIVKENLKYVWVKFRKVAPVLDGATWTAGTYASGDQVYHEGTGDFYEANASTAFIPGQDSTWDKIEIPYIFQKPAAYYGASELKRIDGDIPGADALRIKADEALQMEVVKVFKQQRQDTRIAVNSSY